jgi:predicted site-specific integrase-resolvase
MTVTLLIAREVERLFRWPRGRALRLARSGSLPHVVLPDGEIRFPEDSIERIARGEKPATEGSTDHA